MKKLFILPIFIIMLAGCPKTDTKPTENPLPPISGKSSDLPELSVEQQLQRRKAVAECKKKELEERVKQDAAIKQIATDDKKNCEEEIRQQTLAFWRSLCMWIGIGGIVASLIIAGLVIYYRGNLSMASKIVAAGGLIAAICFGIMWVLAHLWLTIFVLGGFAVAIAIVRIFGNWQNLKDGASILAKSTKENAEAFEAQLARAKIHNIDTFKPWLEGIRK